MVAEDFSTPKVVTGGKFMEFTDTERHHKVYVRPEDIIGVEDAEAWEKQQGSCLLLSNGGFLLVEQECVQIVAVLARRVPGVPEAPVPLDDPFAQDDGLVALGGET